ncbi:GH3 auxin-responsive promoter family protein [Dyadobacter sp. CY345]|uniref:GH3 auxin-responsive promoter family protein n=1 Tax=Dyadobacter sp. CY345 TaxID=2909335 RepID=UPI001F47BE71|nr:GH3 auxin-responsive promoter family protein [Dyadobacter sp. CY345]MCF2446128.1 GH3 auxin-responsive promoter family protein [Dyadobacter sp. CY345]
MKLVNNMTVWFLKRRFERIEQFMQNPIETQQRIFSELIETARYTEWGTKYNFGQIKSIKEFQDQVPVSSYEELYPYIERVLKGEPNVLWPSQIEWFSKSSGTTNARSKFLPVSPEALEECHYEGGKDMMTLLINNRPETRVFDGKGLSIGGTLHANPFDDYTQVGDVSAVIMQNLPAWGEFMRTPPLEVALMDHWETKLEKMASICSQENVTSILGVPTWTIVLLDQILELTGKSNMLEVWPDFEVFVHGAVSFEPYRDLFTQKYFPSEQVTYLETYSASEGFFAIQDDLSKVGEMLLMLDYGIFYEFLPMDEVGKPHPKALLLDEVEVGKNYALVISTNAGLWRYLIGDTVKFTSKYPFRLKVSGRTKHFINAFGEEVIVENADHAIKVASQKTESLVSNYTAGPVYMGDGSRGRHEWIIEFTKEPENREEFIQILDKTLREVNSDYDAKRYKDMALLSPLVHFAPVNTFYNWMSKRRKLGGQNKVPRLSNDRVYLEDLLGQSAFGSQQSPSDISHL